MKTFFIDFEASSLDDASCPIEIAWVDQNGQGESYLIRPEPDWTNWSLQSQKIHRITRPVLWKQGLPAAQVARRAMTVLSGATLVSDNPDYDGHWLAMLLGVIYEKSEIAPINFDHLIGQEIKRMLRLLDDRMDSPSRWYQERLLLDEGQMLAAHAIDQHIFDKRIRHRALPDATHLWQKWKTVNAAIDHRLRPVTT